MSKSHSIGFPFLILYQDMELQARAQLEIRLVWMIV